MLCVCFSCLKESILCQFSCSIMGLVACAIRDELPIPDELN